MAELWSLPGGADTAANQVLYNLTRRGIEWDLLPWCRERRLPVMAYSPIEQGRILRKRALGEPVIVIPKAGRPEHVRENRAALDLVLAPDELAELDRAFPPPDRGRPLEML